MITVERGLTNRSAFAREVVGAAKKVIAAQLADVGADAVRRVDAIVAKDYNNDRTGYRSKGGTKLLGSFRFEVIKAASPTQPVKLRLFSVADDAKVASLNFGSPAHTISARDAATLVFPAGVAVTTSALTGRPLLRNTTTRFRGTGKAAHSQDGPPLVRPVSVEHPGNNPGRFMERALNGAVRARYRTAALRE